MSAIAELKLKIEQIGNQIEKLALEKVKLEAEYEDFFSRKKEEPMHLSASTRSYPFQVEDINFFRIDNCIYQVNNRVIRHGWLGEVEVSFNAKLNLED